MVTLLKSHFFVFRLLKKNQMTACHSVSEMARTTRNATNDAKGYVADPETLVPIFTLNPAQTKQTFSTFASVYSDVIAEGIFDISGDAKSWPRVREDEVFVS